MGELPSEGKQLRSQILVLLLLMFSEEKYVYLTEPTLSLSGLSLPTDKNL